MTLEEYREEIRRMKEGMPRIPRPALPTELGGPLPQSPLGPLAAPGLSREDLLRATLRARTPMPPPEAYRRTPVVDRIAPQPRPVAPAGVAPMTVTDRFTEVAPVPSALPDRLSLELPPEAPAPAAAPMTVEDRYQMIEPERAPIAQRLSLERPHMIEPPRRTQSAPEPPRMYAGEAPVIEALMNRSEPPQSAPPVPVPSELPSRLDLAEPELELPTGLFSSATVSYRHPTSRPEAAAARAAAPPPKVIQTPVGKGVFPTTAKITAPPAAIAQSRTVPKSPTGKRVLVSVPDKVAYVIGADGYMENYYPVFVGTKGQPTPRGTFNIMRKYIPGEDEGYLGPGWASFKESDTEQWGFHGWDNRWVDPAPGATHGCIQLDNNDLKDFYQRVGMGTNVEITDKPYVPPQRRSAGLIPQGLR